MRGGGLGGAGGLRPLVLVTQGFWEGDRNHDGLLSREEFAQLGETWFTSWDTNHTGKLNAEQLRAGLVSTFGLPEFGGARMGLLGAPGQRNGLAAARGIEFEYVHADLDFAGHLFTNVAVRYKGNGTFMQSRNSLKRSLKIDLNKYVPGQKLAGVVKLNLHNNVTDPSWMNEALSYRLYREAGVPAPRTAYARVFVTVPGKFDRKYFGLYSLVEDLDKKFIEENMGTRKGAIFKPVTPNLFGDLGGDWAKYKQTYDPKTDVSEAETARVIEFCRLVTQSTDKEFTARAGQYLDLEEFARFMAVTVWLSTLDSILGAGQNFYVYLHPKTRQFQFLPWDLDHSFGQFGLLGTQEQRENLSIQKPWRGEKQFLERVFKLEAFKKLYRTRMDEFSKTIFKPERFHRQVDEIAAVIRDAVKEESSEQLARLEKAVAGEIVEPAGGGGGFGRNGQGRAGQARKPIKAFVDARAQSVLEQLAGKSAGRTMEGFGGPGGRGGFGGAGGFGPANILARAFLTALDINRDGEISRDEFRQGFTKWFNTWDTDRSGKLTEEQIRAGINGNFTIRR